MTDSATSPAPTAPAPIEHRLGYHVRRTVVMALPVMLARAGLVLMITVDTIMVGQLGGLDLAHFAISFAPQITLFVVGVGMLVGTSVLAAQADGAGRPEVAGRAWRLALIIAGGLGLIYMALLLPGEWILRQLGQSDEMSTGGGAVLTMWAVGMPGILFYVATSYFLEGVGRPRPGMVVMILANVVNLGLNYLLVFGHHGFPQMGAEGAVLATSIARWFMAIALIGYTLLTPAIRKYGIYAPLGADVGQQMRKLLKIGWPVALSIGFESSCFSAAATFAGWLGAVPLAAYQVAINFNAVVFMLAIGLSMATSVRVANAVGRDDQPGIAWAGWVGSSLVVPTMALASALLIFAPAAVVAVYTDDPQVVPVAIGLLAVVAWLVIFDGAQAALMGAVRGAADIWIPTIIYGVSFWLIGIPLCYLLAIRLDYGVEGLMTALGLALILATVALGWRFHLLTRRHIKAV